MPKIKVNLALSTPLYAPLFLAFAMAKENDAWHAAEFSVSAPPNPSRDPLLDDLVDNRIDDETLVLAVGDPMRACSLPSTSPANGKLSVCGVLVDKMAFWLLNGSALDFDSVAHHSSRPDAKHWCNLDKVLSHPIGMTGYTVSVIDYYLGLSGKENPTLEDVRALMPMDAHATKIVPSASLKDERKSYEEWKKSNSLENQHTAYISMNPVCAHQARDTGEVFIDTFFSHNDHPLAHRASKTRLPQEFDNSITTAVISRRIDQSHRLFDLRQRAISELTDAITAIQQDPLAAAWTLTTTFGSFPDFPFQGMSESTLSSVLKSIGELNIYNHDKSTHLRVPRININNTKKLRAAVEPCLPHNHKRIAVSTLQEYFEDIDAGESPSPK